MINCRLRNQQPMASSSGTIKQFKLQGHKSSVLCLAHSSDIDRNANTVGCLLSGSEDKTARIWDLRGGTCRASICVVAPGEVVSAAFAPKQSSSDQTASGAFARNFSIYIGVGNQVLGYDLRKASSPIVKAVDDDLTEIIDTEEEISQISFATRGSTSMAVADDGGKVFVTNPLSPPLPKKKKKRRRWVLQHDEDCLAMVTSCVFRPRGGDVLASGGTDCMVRLWDVSKPRQPIASHHVTREDTGVNQICNPPMVHSMAWSPSGRLLAAGLGDGTIEVVRFLPQDKQSLVRVARLRDGHDATVASVVFPEFVSPSSSNHVAAHDRLLVSAGTDGAIFLWDLGKRVCGNGALHPSNDVLAGSNSTLETEMNNMSLANNGDDPNLLFGIPHQHKPNWMVSTRGADTVFPSTLFVADTSNDITGYSIPLQS